MFNLTQEKLTELGAQITTREIKQQPKLWKETLEIWQTQKDQIAEFLNHITPEKKVRVLFTGAGTSQYVGDTVLPYLRAFGDTDRYKFESIGTTDIVSRPLEFLQPDEPTLLVSFARSGNSPESVAAIEIANQVVKEIYHLVITCAPEGKLAQNEQTKVNSYVLLMPALSNDAGFAMTGSFSCMSLAALLVFDTTATKTKASYVITLTKLGSEVVEREAEIKVLLDDDFERIIYLGSGSLGGLTREAQLKVLELTAGKIATVFDSSMGFRHGPKSFVNDKALVFDFVNNDEYTRQYDIDVLEEIKGDQIAKHVVAIGQANTLDFSGEKFFFNADEQKLPDGYLALADVMFAQTVALLASVKIGNTPDTPSPTGTVNRVVKGVIIHDFSC